MAANSKIEWTHHTFNPWRGCSKVSEGCKFCYADSLAKRNPGTLGIWGPNGTRVVARESMWKEPLKWDQKAQESGERHRVFCASMADVFEDWDGWILDSKGNVVQSIDGPGGPQITLNQVRDRLFRLIDATPNLDWLLLTKRPENIWRMWPLTESGADELISGKHDNYRQNVWLGTSASTQRECETNWLSLQKLIPLCSVVFLSLEPLIESICLEETWRNCPLPNWVIVGGESGPNARRCDVLDVANIVEDCKAANVPVFVKQLGSNPFIGDSGDPHGWPARNSPVDWDIGEIHLNDRKGGDLTEWPEDLRVREFPEI